MSQRILLEVSKPPPPINTGGPDIHYLDGSENLINRKSVLTEGKELKKLNKAEPSFPLNWPKLLKAFKYSVLGTMGSFFIMPMKYGFVELTAFLIIFPIIYLSISE